MHNNCQIYHGCPRPFVKWAGGKSQLLTTIASHLPSDFIGSVTKYVEPFVGGGAMLFFMIRSFPSLKAIVINDLNHRLINVYECVKSYHRELVHALLRLNEQYLPLSYDDRKRFFYEKRCSFNASECEGTESASLFIFLNRTCFNGLYRENSRGMFNVPHGRYSNPRICDIETIIEDHEALQGVSIKCGDFSRMGCEAGEDAFFYLDPPYKPIDGKKAFAGYGKDAFTDDDQVRLKGFCDYLDSVKCRFILSNSDCLGGGRYFESLYADYDIAKVFAPRMINVVGEKRGKISELLIKNY